MKKKSRSVALAGMLAALAVVLLLFGSLFELLDLSASAMASLAVMVALIELGKGWACGVYAVTAVLSLLLFPSRTAPITFAAFIGYYPVLKVYLDRIKPRLLQYFAKLLPFNAFLFVSLWLLERLINAQSDWLSGGWPIYVLGNVTFLIFDFALARLSLFYIVKIKNRIRRQ